VVGYNRSQEFSRMKPIEFCYWLKGILDTSNIDKDGLLPDDTKLIKDKLEQFVGGDKQAPKGLQ
jgi:hypothetical protein